MSCDMKFASGREVHAELATYTPPSEWVGLLIGGIKRKT